MKLIIAIKLQTFW